MLAEYFVIKSIDLEKSGRSCIMFQKFKQTLTRKNPRDFKTTFEKIHNYNGSETKIESTTYKINGREVTEEEFLKESSRIDRAIGGLQWTL